MSNKQTKTKSLWALSHRKKLLPWLAPLASLRLTLALLSLSMVLIFIATLEQVKLGIRGAQAEYFESLVGIWNYPDEFWGGGKSSPDWTRRSALVKSYDAKPRTTVSRSRITDLKPVTSSSTWTRAREKPSMGFHATSAISQSSKRIPIIFSNSRPTNPNTNAKIAVSIKDSGSGEHKFLKVFRFPFPIPGGYLSVGSSSSTSPLLL